MMGTFENSCRQHEARITTLNNDVEAHRLMELAAELYEPPDIAEFMFPATPYGNMLATLASIQAHAHWVNINGHWHRR